MKRTSEDTCVTCVWYKKGDAQVIGGCPRGYTVVHTDNPDGCSTCLEYKAKEIK